MPEPRAGRVGGAEAEHEVDLLGFRARVRGPRPLLRELRRAFPAPPAWASPAEPVATSAFHIALDTPRPGWRGVARDGLPLWATARPGELLPYLDWAINTTAIERLERRYLFLHAGAVAHAGRGLILPAASGSGKTTLTAALLRAGFDYLSDEVAALDLRGGRLVPFAKSLRVKRGARRVLAPLYPRLVSGIPGHRLDGRSVWYLPPPAGAWPSEPVPVAHVVFPEYVPNGATRLVPLPRGEALARLLCQAFGSQAPGAAGIAGLVGLLQGASCYALAVGDLQRAVGLLRRVAA